MADQKYENDAIGKLVRRCEALKVQNEELSTQCKTLQQEKRVQTDKYIKALEELNELRKIPKPVVQQPTPAAAPRVPQQVPGVPFISGGGYQVSIIVPTSYRVVVPPTVTANLQLPPTQAL